LADVRARHIWPARQVIVLSSNPTDPAIAFRQRALGPAEDGLFWIPVPKRFTISRSREFASQSTLNDSWKEWRDSFRPGTPPVAWAASWWAYSLSSFWCSSWALWS
jgi:hypothetical protein